METITINSTQKIIDPNSGALIIRAEILLSLEAIQDFRGHYGQLNLEHEIYDKIIALLDGYRI